MNSDMVKKQPLVSVIITNYNYGQYIKEALDSVVAQTYKNIELIVIDDGSTDDSVEIIDQFKKDHPSAVVIKQKNKGVVFARNKGLEKLKGDYLVFLDSDDKLPNNYIEVLVNKAETEQADVVYTDLQRFDGENEVIEYPEFSLDIIKNTNIAHASSLIRVKSIKSHRFDEHLNKRSHEDWDFMLGLALMRNKFSKSNDVKLNYRAHGQSRSTTSGELLDKQAYNFVVTTLYIIDKYKKQYPGEVDLSPSTEFITWWRLAHERLDLIHRFQKDQKENQSRINNDKNYINTLKLQIREKDSQIQKVKNSKRYKIGNAILAPASAIKSILNKKAR